MDKHAWAFYYYCLRRGDRVTLEKHGDGTMSISILKVVL